MVGHVQLRNARVTISVAMDGPRFSVVSTEGVTLATRLPLDEFESRFPEMAPAVRWSVAIDASVDRQLLRERDGRQSEPAPLHGRLLNRLD